MGGHQAGDYASKYTVEVLTRAGQYERAGRRESACFGDQDSQQRDHQKSFRGSSFKGDGDDGSVASIVNQMMYFGQRGRQQAVSDQSGNRTAYKRSFSGGRDGTPWRDQAGGSKASSG